METKIILCDSCKKRVAEDKCDFCGKDLCVDCVHQMNIHAGNVRRVTNFVMCDNCDNRVHWEGLTLDEEIKQILLDKIKKRLMADELLKDKANENEAKKYPHITLTPATGFGRKR